jgi:hypothetical protein
VGPRSAVLLLAGVGLASITLVTAPPPKAVVYRVVPHRHAA